MLPLSGSVSVAVEVTVSWKSPSSLFGGVIASPVSWSAVNVAAPPEIVMVSPAVLVRTAPSGIPLISMDRVSEPSVSPRAEEMSSAIGSSSSPEEVSSRLREGWSATASTVTGRSSVSVAVSPVASSVEVAVIERLKLSALSSGGVIERPASCSAVSVAEPPLMMISSPAVLESKAPSGIPATVIDRVSEPSVSVNALVIFNAIAVSSSPLASAVVLNVGSDAVESSKLISTFSMFSKLIPSASEVKFSPFSRFPSPSMNSCNRSNSARMSAFALCSAETLMTRVSSVPAPPSTISLPSPMLNVIVSSPPPP